MMPYKDPIKRAEYKKEWFDRTRERTKEQRMETQKARRLRNKYRWKPYVLIHYKDCEFCGGLMVYSPKYRVVKYCRKCVKAYKVVKKCVCCGKQINKRYSNKGNFCNISCMNKYNVKIISDKYLKNCIGIKDPNNLELARKNLELKRLSNQIKNYEYR